MVKKDKSRKSKVKSRKKVQGGSRTVRSGVKVESPKSKVKRKPQAAAERYRT